MRHAIICINVGRVCWRICMLLGLDDLTKFECAVPIANVKCSCIVSSGKICNAIELTKLTRDTNGKTAWNHLDIFIVLIAYLLFINCLIISTCVGFVHYSLAKEIMKTIWRKTCLSMIWFDGKSLLSDVILSFYWANSWKRSCASSDNDMIWWYTAVWVEKICTRLSLYCGHI